MPAVPPSQPVLPTNPSAPHLIGGSLSSWEHRLLFSLTQVSDSLLDGFGTRSLILACNGSVRGSQGSFGWVLGTPTCHYWTCAGPVDGSPSCISSQRAELTGILSALRFLHHFLTHNNLDVGPDFPIKIVCDSKSAIKYATPPTAELSAIQANHPDFDLAAEIHATLSVLPILIEFEWVKGHQDRRHYQAQPRGPT